LKTKRLKEKKEKKKAVGIGSVAKAVKFFEKKYYLSKMLQ